MNYVRGMARSQNVVKNKFTMFNNTNMRSSLSHVELNSVWVENRNEPQLNPQTFLWWKLLSLVSIKRDQTGPNGAK